LRLAVFIALSGIVFLPPALHAQGAVSASSAGSAGPKWVLVPMPREIHERASVSLSRGVGVFAAGRDAQDAFTVKDLVAGLKERGVNARASHGGHARIELLRENSGTAQRILERAHVTFSPAMHDQGYVLLTEGNRCYDIAATATGLYYGAQTIKQLVSGGSGQDATPVLRGVLVRDWPAMQYRGQDDDLSRGPVPTLAFQEHQVRVLSEYKVNVYSPYFENTLKYPENPLAAPPGGAMTEADVKALVAYARRYHVIVIPEQEAFGHLNHVLTYDMYSKLAETPHGSVLAPGQPGSLKLIGQWFTQISKMFPGPFIHIGADETFSLGRGQTKARVQKEGLDAVYIDFLKQIHQELAPLHKRILFWGDIAMHSPQLVKTLPQDMIAVPWVYNPQPQGYSKWIKPYVAAGMETWVAPGVSNWRRVYPDFNAGFLNIQRFVADGQRLGATGELNTVWNDFGEGLFNLDWYGALYGAAAGWEPGPANIAQFQDSYGQVFHGDTTGKINQAQKKLMAAQKVLEGVGLAATTAHTFWVDPWSAEGQEISGKLLPVAHTVRVDAEQAIVLIDEAREAGHLREPHALDAMEMGARRLDFIGYKFEAAQQIAEEYNRAYWEQKDPVLKEHVGRKLGAISGVDGGCQNIRDGFGLMRDMYRKAWLEENRPYWLDNVMAKYELAQQRWIERANRFAEIQREWYQTHKLPTPEDVGLPMLPGTVPQVSPSTQPQAASAKGSQ
jgi:hypothetical protein